MHNYTYLALGDSYTIGESVLLQMNFPYQVVQSLREKGFSFTAPEIIAKTGWTTDELQQSMNGYQFLQRYDFVTLLIGVNNQYRERDIIEYKEQLEELVKKTIELVNGKKDHVIMISIPDWGVTPFAEGRDRKKISHEIDMFNSVKKALSIQFKVKYIDITNGSRLASKDATLLAEDGLHPSEIEYANWAEKITEIITAQLK